MIVSLLWPAVSSGEPSEEGGERGDGLLGSMVVSLPVIGDEILDETSGSGRAHGVGVR
jgi:hypothetical protein